MTHKCIVLLVAFLLSAEHLSSAYDMRETRSADSQESDEKTESPNSNPLTDNIISSGIREEFEREEIKETLNFLNNFFQSQIDYFKRVKELLPVTAKRVKDIDRYIAKLQRAIAVDSVAEKDKMWRDIFFEFSDSSFLFNNEKDTGVTNSRYLEILNESGLEETTKKFLTNVAKYFWKMAKVSGKAVESTIDDQIEKWRKESLLV